MLRVQVRKRRGSFSLDVDFHAPVPGITALFGRSGCGKSTLISLIAGLLSPDQGRIQLGEQVLLDTERDHELDARHRRIGVVFQDARLFPHLSVLGNLMYGAKRLPRGVPTPIALDDVVQLLGLGEMLDSRPHALSGGEKQRVALGRALLSQPGLLLLDEPMASLDLARREELLPYFEAAFARRGKIAEAEQLVQVFQGSAAQQCECAVLALEGQPQRVAQRGGYAHATRRGGDFQQRAVDIEKQREVFGFPERGAGHATGA